MHVVQTPSGAYREAGRRVGDRFVYPFKLSAPEQLVRATVLYPDDESRAAGVSTWGPPQEALGSGYMCGDDIPLTHHMLKREYLFFSRTQDAALVFSTEAPNQPAAVASITIDGASPALSPAPAPALAARNHRRMGLTWEDPVLSRCFGEPDSVNPADFDLVLERCAEYSKWIGLREIDYPAYWYTAPMFQSRSATGYPLANRLHPPDALVRIARLCDDHGIVYVPVLNVFKLSSFKQFMLDEKAVIAGQPSVNTVADDGRIVTWQNARLWRDSIATAIHPSVQDACGSLLVEIAQQCAPFESFKGIDLALWPGTVFKLGSSAPGDASMSFDDYTVEAFAADSRLIAPGKAGEADRFARRSQWLREDPNRWQMWLKWRARRMTEFYARLAQKLASIKPGAKLGLCIYSAFGPPENESADINREIYASGIDLDALSKDPNITIKRYAQQMLPRWRYRQAMPRPKNLNIENTPAFQAPFANRPGMGFIVHQQYFETPVGITGQTLSLPEPYPDEMTATKPNNGLRVTEPLPRGRDYLRFFANAIRLYDPVSMTVGGYVLGTQGAESEIREMASAFSALPAIKFDDVLITDQIAIRRAVSEGKTWVYIVNLTPDPQSVAISVRDGEVRNVTTGESIIITNDVLTIECKPFELFSLCGPETLVLTHVEPTTAPALPESD